MTKIDGYKFKGEYSINGEDVPPVAGVFVVITIVAKNKFMVIDIDCSDNLRRTIKHHDRKEEWLKKKKEEMYIMIYKEKSEGIRNGIVQDLRDLRKKNICDDTY